MMENTAEKIGARSLLFWPMIILVLIGWVASSSIKKAEPPTPAPLSAQEIKFGPRPEPSQWDGSYRVVEQYLKVAAHDPSSIKIVGSSEVFHTDKGWLVRCDYRGKNAFGAVVLDSHWYTIKNGQVINVEPASAYR